MRRVEPLSYRQIRVGQFTIGMNGLDEIFAQLLTEGRAPDAIVPQELLGRVRRHNYVPTTAEDVYAEALLSAYRAFCQQQAAGCNCRADYGTWRGYPRERVPWYPTINAGRCDDCAACMRFCPNGVFASGEGGEVQVVEPFRCQVGCSACVQVCELDAITFPSRAILDTFGSGA